MHNYIKQIKKFNFSAKMFLITGVLFGISMGMRRVVRNLYFLSLGYGEQFVGLVISISTLFGVFIALPSGKISDYFGRKKALLIAVALSVVGIALQGTVSKTIILMGASLHRMGVGLVFIAGPAFLAEQSRTEERTHLFSAYDGIRRISITLGALLGGYLPGTLATYMTAGGENPLSYRMTIFIQALILVLAFIPVVMLSDKDKKEEIKQKELDESKSLFDFSFSQKELPKKILIPALFIGLGAGFIFPFMNVIFKHFGASTNTIGWIFSVESILGGLATFAVPVIARKLGKVKGLTIIRMISLPFLLVIGFAGYIPVMAVALWIRSSLMRMGMPLRKNILMDVTVFSDRSKASSLNQVAFRSGWVIAGPIAGWLMANISYGIPFIVTSISYIAGILSFYKYFKPLEENQSDSG